MDKERWVNLFKYESKGISTEVIIFAILALVIVVVAVFFLSGRFGPGVTQLSKEDCKQRMQAACSSFRSTGNNAVFKDIPQTCARDLGVSSQFTNCLSDNLQECRNLCDAIEIGVVPGEAGEVLPQPGEVLPQPPG
jgi:hypothetical protein